MLFLTLITIAFLCALPFVVLFRIVTGRNAMTPEQIGETKGMMAPQKGAISKRAIHQNGDAA